METTDQAPTEPEAEAEPEPEPEPELEPEPEPEPELEPEPEPQLVRAKLCILCIAYDVCLLLVVVADAKRVGHGTYACASG
jgi:hypothetical protein